MTSSQFTGRHGIFMCLLYVPWEQYLCCILVSLINILTCTMTVFNVQVLHFFIHKSSSMLTVQSEGNNMYTPEAMLSCSHNSHIPAYLQIHYHSTLQPCIVCRTSIGDTSSLQYDFYMTFTPMALGLVICAMCCSVNFSTITTSNWLLCCIQDWNKSLLKVSGG